MQFIYRTVLPILVAITAIACPTLHAQTPGVPSGHWAGLIHIPDHELRFTVDLAKSSTGAWIGSVSILGSETRDVPLSNVVVANDVLKFVAGLPDKTTFEAKLSSDAKTIAGTVGNLDGFVPFDLTREGEPNVNVPPPSSPLVKSFAGRWEGSLGVGPKVVRLALTIDSSPDGIATATLLTLDQPKSELVPATSVSMEGARIEVEARSVSGTFKGTLGQSGEIAGEWIQGDLRAPLTFKRVSGGR